MLEEIRTIQENAICLYTQSEVEAALDNMAAAINQQLAEQNPLLLCVINGGIITAGQLLTRLTFPLTLDSIQASRYRNQTSGSEIQWLFKPSTPVAGRNILIVDDILDEGFTLAAIIDWCKSQGAAAVYSAVLLDKQLGHDKPLQADFVGLQVANHYLFGFGLDYKAYLRNANGIFACKDVL
jgi:hypoxanthine phosphoribosyltransferase